MNPFRMPVAYVALIFFLMSGCTRTLHEEDLFWPPSSGDPAFLEGISAQAIEVAAADSVTLRGWVVGHQDFNGSILYFYGNNEKAAYLFGGIHKFAEIVRLNVICIDYRGYGFSDGSPSLEKLREDALLIYDTWIGSDYEKDLPLLVFGRSLGAAVAVYLASERPVDGLILEAALTSVSEIIPRMRAEAPWYSRWLVRLSPGPDLYRWEQPIEMIRRIEAPILLVHGERDELVHMDEARSMLESSPAEVKMMCPVAEASHFDGLLGSPAITDSLEKFMGLVRAARFRAGNVGP
jgi:pimeloyl-ACP methyl ester carboxylesterase